jgi:hypothetical protein
MMRRREFIALLGGAAEGRYDRLPMARHRSDTIMLDTPGNKPLCRQLICKDIDACHVAARPGEASDKTKPDRVLSDDEDDGDGCGCRLGRERRGGSGLQRSRRPVGEPDRPPAPAPARLSA